MDMDDEKMKLKLISELMDQLQDEMQPNSDDLASRLGRQKPDLEVVKVSGKAMPGMEDADMDDSMEDGKEMPSKMDMMGKGMSEDPMGMGADEESPDEMLKKRLMKMRG